MAHTFISNLQHIVFSTKDRAAILTPDLKSKLFPYMSGIVKKLGCQALIINGPTDHVHILASISTETAISSFLRVLKSNSSGWVNKNGSLGRRFSWQVGYGAFSVSESNQELVSKYIENQEQHHQKMTFKKEFVTLLNKHRIQYDEQYLWE